MHGLPSGGPCLTSATSLMSPMSKNSKYNHSEPLEKSQEMIEYEKKAIEHWRKLYPHLSDEELLEIDDNIKRYVELVLEIEIHDLKKDTPDNS